ncbi:MAG: hypothetical protein CL537_10460 [Alcanivoracaceae bacterium]|nr:hypothetical protein [Alcanivoracaceae bacterium]|tara:strand:+ start:247 stop:2634 length:2388 start_codon:yes stop_codon:yes gene_type:complete
MQQTFPTIRHRLTPLAVATHFTFGSAFLASIALPIMLPQQAMAETQSVTLNIPAGSLAAALNTFAEQAGVYLSTNGKLVAGKQSNGLQGTFSVEQGLNQLLQGSGLSYRFSDNNTVSIISAEQDSASTLDPIQVSAGARNGAAPSTESSMSYTKEEISSTTKLRLSPRETPQIVNVVTHQVAEDFGAQDMEDILNLAPGVSVGHTDDDRRSYTARGYAMAIQYDGLPSTSGIDGGVVAGPDSALLDSTEILLGAAGLMNGAGQPGGVINMNYKRPTRNYQASAELMAGSWDLRRMVVDVSGGLTESDRIRARVVAVDQAEESFRDVEREKKKVFYSIIEGDLTDSTLLSLSIQTQDIYDNVTDRSGLPSDNAGNDMDWSRSTFLAPAWNRWNKYATTYRAKVEQQLPSDWLLIVQASTMKSEADWLFGTLSSFDSDTGDATFSRWGQYNKETSDDAELYLRGPLELFGRSHELVFGGNWTERLWTGISGDGTDYSTNLYGFDPQTSVPAPEITLNQPINDQITRQYGGYAAGHFTVTDRLKAIIGSRLSWYHYEYSGTERDEDRIVTPYMGLTYDLNSWASVYASYTDIFNPQSAKDTSGNTLDPELGASYEAGFKGEFYDGLLNASVTAFRIRKDNEALLNSSIPFDANNACGGWCYEANGKTTTDGFDLGLAGRVTESIQIMGGFTQYKKDDNDETVRITKLSGSYTPPSQKWSTGVSIDNSTKSYGQWGMSQDARTLVGAFGRYQINPQLDIALNLHNLLDEEYYANAIDSGYGRQYWGEPRSWTVALRGKW